MSRILSWGLLVLVLVAADSAFCVEQGDGFDLEKYLDPPYLISTEDISRALEKASVDEYQVSNIQELSEGSIWFKLKKDEKVFFSVSVLDHRIWNKELKSILIHLKDTTALQSKIPSFVKVRREGSSYSLVDTINLDIRHFDLKRRYMIRIALEERKFASDDEALKQIGQTIQAIVSSIEARVPDAKGQDAKK